MSRYKDILFKAKRLDNNEWAYGHYFATWSCRNGVRTDHHYIRNYDTDDYFKIDPETLKQYIGRADKNGNKVFEGDILKGYQYPFCHEGEYNYFAEVLWFDNSPAFGIYTFKNPTSQVRGVSTGNCEYLEDWDSNDWEVIGNILDNPELLK